MSSVLAAPGQGALRTTTVRQFQRAAGFALLLAGLGCLVYAAEKYLFQPQTHFAEKPIEVMVQAFGLAHFLIGWLFLFTSPRLRSRQAVGRLAVATLAGVALCGVFALFGGTRNPLLVIVFYGYFLLHEIRDEARLYRAYGDAPRSHPGSQKVLDSLSLAASVVLMTVLAAGYTLYLTATPKDDSDGPQPMLLASVLSLLLVVCGWATYRFLQQAHKVYGDLRAASAAHRPLLIVYGGILALLAVSSILGSIGFIVLMHVAAWLVIVSYQLGQRPPTLTRNLWTWLRGTPAGFWVLHVGLALVILVLLAVRVHVWHRFGFLSELLASKNFCYWGLMHISMAFWSSR